jgi:hypothetical protein
VNVHKFIITNRRSGFLQLLHAKRHAKDNTWACVNSLLWTCQTVSVKNQI